MLILRTASHLRITTHLGYRSFLVTVESRHGDWTVTETRTKKTLTSAVKIIDFRISHKFENRSNNGLCVDTWLKALVGRLWNMSKKLTFHYTINLIKNSLPKWSEMTFLKDKNFVRSKFQIFLKNLLKILVEDLWRI